ncbi:cytochrome P450 [Mycena floridula]|nr:cytochrome P450 [Mycena floridula]
MITQLITAAVVLAILYRLALGRHHEPLPPGPPAHPIIGHLLKIPGTGQEECFHNWAKTYGDIIHLRVLGRNLIIIDSHETAVELLDKRSAIYSCRPKFTVYELMGWAGILTFMPYGKRFLKHRKVLQQYFGRQESVSYQSGQVHEARVLLKNLLAKPERYDFYFNRFSTAVISRIAFGHEIVSDDDPFMEIAEYIVHSLNSSGPAGNTPPDFFPILQYIPGSWFPGTYYADLARKWHWATRKMHDYPYDLFMQQMAQGIHRPSILTSEVERVQVDGEISPDELEEVKGVMATIYGAGAETTWSTLCVFFMAMLLHPECQRRCQAEIDIVVGSGRLPDFSDRESLPYLNCVLQETLRWYPTVHLGIPHRTTEPDIYNGYFIPKGSIVFANAAGICQNEAVYANPQEFNPSRFLPKPEGNNEPHPAATWGYGRRICPGRHFADGSLWIAMASMLAVFDISKAIDNDGKEITPQLTFTIGLIHHADQVPCIIRPRSTAAEHLILDT